MKRFKSIVMAAFAAVLAGTYVLPGATAGAVSSASLSITPKKNYVIEPGKSVKDKLLVRNLDLNNKLTLTLRVIDFTYSDDSGTPKLFLAQDAPQTTWSLKPFITIPESVTIDPNSSKSLDMNIAIPSGHGAGSYYSAIVYSSGNSSSGGNVGLNASGVTLAFVSIPGKVNENLKLENFGAYTPAAPGKKAGYASLMGDEPQNIAYTLKNSGNVTEAPVGSIKLKDMFGHEYNITNVNPSSSLALIGQTRTFVSCIKLVSQNVDFNNDKTKANTCTSPGLWPGLYTASLDVFYGQNGNATQEVTGNTTFWYLPLWFVIALIVVLLVIAYVVWRIVNFIRRKLYGKKPMKLSHRK